MWFLFIYVQLTATQAQRIILRGSTHPCEGRLEVYYKQQWGLVGHHKWEPKNGEVVCKSLDCGDHVHSGIFDYNYKNLPPLKTFWMDEIMCNGTEDKLWKCKFNGWNVTQCQNKNYVSVKCSGNISLTLNYNGVTDVCAGVVQFTTPKGKVNMCTQDKALATRVCKELNCGEHEKTFRSSSLNLFGHSSMPLNCIGNEDFSWQCVDRDPAELKSCQSKISIICSKHELWFLQGDSPCEGRVKSKTVGYLQNITNEKANEVCARNLCGTTESYTSNMDSSVCPENATSPFNRSTKNTTKSTGPQFAYVKCSGSMRLQLKNKCHGKVEVCSNENCMDLCADTWMEEQSGMLCKSLGCGMAITQNYNGMKKSGVNLTSVHCSQTAENFSQCNFFKLNTSFCQNTAYVFCTGSVKAELHDPRDKCAGNLQLFYSGKWQSVCTDVNQETQNAICTNLGCGEAVSFNKSINMFNSYGLTSITCQDGNISNCDFSNTKVQRCQVGSLNCTGWRRLLLNSTKTACMGKVYLRNQSDLYAVSSDGWSETERNKLCKYLECGKVSETVDEEQMNKAQPFWSRSYNCSGNPQNIWECEKDEAPVEKHHLDIKCTDEPQVNLTGKCTGEVQLKKEHVCSTSQNTDRVFKEFCQELGCSMLFKTWPTKKNSKAARYLSCTGMENKLWQCSSWTDMCENVISLACAGAIDWKLSGTCGGEFQVKYRGKWEPVCPVEKNDADRICMELKCGNASQHLAEETKNRADVGFQCGKDHNYLMHCFGPNTCTAKAVIYCDNYVSVNKIGLIVGVVVGLLVAALIVYWKRKAILASLRFKFSSEDTDVEINENEMQNLNEKDNLENSSENYDDIGTTVNPREENQSEVSTSENDEENMSTSQSSSGTDYEEADEENAKPPANSNPTEPLLPPRPDNLLDKVTFEAEVEPQEDYDDVILPQMVVSEQKERLNIPGPSSNPPLLVLNDEAKHQKDE
ncbi:scavenger receptor cysteine-rich type 1 protein M130-like isoform X2 [Neoarius graeffei]|uniref:scavenger receptor cysteine-rich type 1 protein M130-like isoform X2 n=1 Tax=Neoarius graeffei TaxID=443677 RepID=UPI00298D57A6|nr:scavenger receptor cysteine-rich type 1 protein M130-like isoform X2 [Neoarius graeffei]